MCEIPKKSDDNSFDFMTMYLFVFIVLASILYIYNIFHSDSASEKGGFSLAKAIGFQPKQTQAYGQKESNQDVFILIQRVSNRIILLKRNIKKIDSTEKMLQTKVATLETTISAKKITPDILEVKRKLLSFLKDYITRLTVLKKQYIYNIAVLSSMKEKLELKTELLSMQKNLPTSGIDSSLTKNIKYLISDLDRQLSKTDTILNLNDFERKF